MPQFVNGAATGVIAASRGRPEMVAHGLTDDAARTLVSLFR